MYSVADLLQLVLHILTAPSPVAIQYGTLVGTILQQAGC